MDPEKAELLEVLREHAYGNIAKEKVLTIQPTPHGARVPAHWVEQTDALIVSLLPDDVIGVEYRRRGFDDY